jgi:NNMT/PNMT/TEMT family
VRVWSVLAASWDDAMIEPMAPTSAACRPLQASAPGNRAYPWDEFDPDWYAEHNYVGLREEDHRILQGVRDFFKGFFKDFVAGRALGRGIDVGSGANLYPSLAMLPFCREITLWERGARNVRWLRNEVRWYSAFWNEYWNLLASRNVYAEIEKPRDALQSRARVVRGDLFALPKRRWDIGTMFFVAESVSDQEREFKAAIGRFIGSLKVGAPFATAFMRDSSGYYVDKLRFPAVAVTEADVAHSLTPLVDDLEIKEIQLGSRALREGYSGMILAVGMVGKARR